MSLLYTYNYLKSFYDITFVTIVHHIFNQIYCNMLYIKIYCTYVALGNILYITIHCNTI